MEPNGYYLHNDNFYELGKLIIHDHNPKEKHAILRPVFKVDKPVDQKGVFLFNPGFLDVNKEFYSCPLSIFYVQVNKMIQTITNYGHNTTLEVEFRIFSKDFSKHQAVEIKLDRRNTDFRSMSKIINLTNQFIESNRDIELIDFSVFTKRDLDSKGKSIIIDAVNNLQFEFYDNSLNRVGKDNFFWIEAEIRNLPSDVYLNKLIFEYLEKQCWRIDTTDYGLLMQFDSETAFSAAYSRSKNEDCGHLEKKVKENLKLDMAIVYNSVEQLIEQLTKK